ncbi:MAG: phospholipid carrier-dependent glycosyltransferase [Actinomycetota bacterium]|nr:MAG: phospholipid carrier-dependent glycosyltransferase [Actinomycetota bacterium]
MTSTLPGPTAGMQPHAPGFAPPASSTPAARPEERRSLLGRLVRGRTDDPRWVRPALLAVLLGTGLLYCWGLSASGWANSFYAAAVQAGTQSWKAFFFGSSDAANFITVDKPPASLWVMELSARIFGLNSWSMLVPQALEGVAAVGLLYLAVRRWFTPGAGLLAAAVLALTPVAVLMFRFNNPDALLVLLLVAAAYATIRAIEHGSTRWLVLAGAAIGFGFLTKMLQAFLVVPAFALAFVVAAPTSWWRRLGSLALAGLALLVAGGWWVAVVALLPADWRPYVGGSQTNSIVELILGYNGLGRLSGDETGSVGGGAVGSMWGQTGLSRLFGSDSGGQISWLIPAALLALVVGLLLTARRPRTDRMRASFLLWGGWFAVTFLVFSLMAGIFHAYYNVALAPAIGALVGTAAATLWSRRTQWWARALLAAGVTTTGVWAFVLLRRTPDFVPFLAWVILLGSVVAAALLLLPPVRSVAVAIAAAGLFVVLAGPSAYAAQTAATAHGGSIPSAGPAAPGGFGGRGGLGGAGAAGTAGPGGAGGQRPAGPGTPPTAAAPPVGGSPPAGGGAGQPGAARGGAGGLLGGSTPSAELTATLSADGSAYTWVAAAVGSNSASGYQLATGYPVMAIGGFNGSDPAPSLAAFQQEVAAGRIHYFVGGGGGFGPSQGGSNVANQIATWVGDTFTATTVGGVTVYDLTSPRAQ